MLLWEGGLGPQESRSSAPGLPLASQPLASHRSRWRLDHSSLQEHLFQRLRVKGQHLKGEQWLETQTHHDSHRATVLRTTGGTSSTGRTE